MKEYYTISEVAKMIKESQSLIRFWEQKFEMLSPDKNAHGERFYTQKKLELIQKIHFLVKKRGFTLEGAANELRVLKKMTSKPY
jgi:DNA-binding transcriptional MerR regulator